METHFASGTRRPRTGCIRKPRTIIMPSYIDGSPPSGFSNSGSSQDRVDQEDNKHPSSQSFGGELERGSAPSTNSGCAVKNGLLLHKPVFNGQCLDGEGSKDWKMFKRREKRQDASSHAGGSKNSHAGDSRNSHAGDSKHSNVNALKRSSAIGEQSSAETKPETTRFQKHTVHSNSHTDGSKQAGHVHKEDYSIKAGGKYASLNKVQWNKGRQMPFFKDTRDNESEEQCDNPTIMDLYRSKRVSSRKAYERMETENGRSSLVKNSRDVHSSIGSVSKKAGIKSFVQACSDSSTPSKLKLKVGGITHTVHSPGEQDQWQNVEKIESSSSITNKGPLLKKPVCVSKPGRQRQHLILQDNSDEDGSGKDNATKNFKSVTRHRVEGEGSQGIDNSSQPLIAVRKSSRVPKKRVLDGDDVEVDSKRRRKKKAENEFVNDSFSVDEDGGTDLACNPELDVRKELPLTARQRALKISKAGGDAEAGASTVDFSEGLTAAAPKKPKEHLSEAEQALKKEAAAKRRKQQMEKTAKEIQEVAIQKILGQDSSRRKREEKLQKQRQEIEQEKQAAAMIPAVNTIRWVMGPSGNVVSFSKDLDLPNIFSGPCRYPQERERCAGPSCNNTYKYRDAKTLLPLCSLQCYRAVNNPSGIAPAC